MTNYVAVSGTNHAYRVYLRNGAEQELTERLMAFSQGKKLGFLSDQQTHRIHGARIVASLTQRGVAVVEVIVEGGERAKSLSQLESIYSQLLRSGVNRSDRLICFGGGVVGDLGGFIAATFMRGIEYAQVPTTLLAQVDSSIGGKVGINLPLGKNMVGAFCNPAFVWSDHSFLNTLDEPELRNGMGELVKHALIGDRELLTLVETGIGTDGFQLSSMSWEKLVARAIEVKVEFVQRDHLEHGVRRHLNFGHTLAHALETSSQYNRFSHGEAVAIGMRAMCRASVGVDGLREADVERVEHIFDALGFPPLSIEMLSPDVLKYVRNDKKRVGDNYHLILLRDIGQSREVLLSWDGVSELFEDLRTRLSMEAER